MAEEGPKDFFEVCWEQFRRRLEMDAFLEEMARKAVEAFKAHPTCPAGRCEYCVPRYCLWFRRRKNA